MSAILANASTVPVNKVKSDSATVSTAEIMLIEFQTLSAQVKAIYFGKAALLVTPSVRNQNKYIACFPILCGSQSVMLCGNRTCFLFSLLKE